MNEEQVNDAFYRDLEFGTGGLRGIIGVDTNRMNVHVVAKATQVLSDYINTTFQEKDKLVAISRDSRIKSNFFVKSLQSWPRIWHENYLYNGVSRWQYL